MTDEADDGLVGRYDGRLNERLIGDVFWGRPMKAVLTEADPQANVVRVRSLSVVATHRIPTAGDMKHVTVYRTGPAS